MPDTPLSTAYPDLTGIAALTPTNNDVLQRKSGAWTNRTLAQLIADLAALGTAFQPLDADLTAIAALTTTAFGRAVLALADAAALRTAGGLVIGTDVEAHDPDLTTIAGLSATNDDVLQRKAGAWANRTLAQLMTDLVALGTGFQPLDSDLTAIAALSTTANGRSLLTASALTAAGLGLTNGATIDAWGAIPTANKADLASPALTGTPTAPTAAAGTNTTQIATTAFVQAYGGYVLDGGFFAAFSPADGATYYIGYGEVLSVSAHTTYANAKMTVPRAGKITNITWSVFVNTNGSNEATSHFLRLNDTTDTTLSTSETYDPGATTAKVFNYTGLSIAVAAGDTIAFKIVCPTWATNPAMTTGHLTVFIQ